MPNHIHLIWEILNPHQLPGVQRDFLKYTAQQLKFALLKENSMSLELFRVSTSDREYQIWERNPLSVNLFTESVLVQKLNYIHGNPLNKKWSLCEEITD